MPAGQSVQFFVLYSGGGLISLEPRNLADALAARERAIAFWQTAKLPFDHIQVPDPGIQALVDS